MNLEWAKNKVKSMKAAMLGRKPKDLVDLAPKGFLSIRADYHNGRVDTLLEDDPNTIMYAARRAHLAHLYDSAATTDLITSFKVGSGGAIGSDTSGNTNIKVIAPDPSATSLYSPISLVNDAIEIVASTAEDDPDEVYLQILFTLSQDDANGLDINECGLFKDSGLIFNHKTFSSITKNESFSLIFDWKIKYI